MVKPVNKQTNTQNAAPAVKGLEKISLKITNWIGTPSSVIAHTIAFIICFTFYFFGVGLDKVLLILTTAVSLEAIYLAIFIQMTVNRNTKSLEEVEEDIEDIQEEVEDLGEDVEDIQEDLEEIQEDDEKDVKAEVQTKLTLDKIQEYLNHLLKDVENLKKQSDNRTSNK